MNESYILNNFVNICLKWTWMCMNGLHIFNKFVNICLKRASMCMNGSHILNNFVNICLKWTSMCSMNGLHIFNNFNLTHFEMGMHSTKPPATGATLSLDSTRRKRLLRLVLSLSGYRFYIFPLNWEERPIKPIHFQLGWLAYALFIFCTIGATLIYRYYPSVNYAYTKIWLSQLFFKKNISFFEITQLMLKKKVIESKSNQLFLSFLFLRFFNMFSQAQIES